MGQKAKVKLAQGKRVKTMAEAKEKAANRASCEPTQELAFRLDKWQRDAK